MIIKGFKHSEQTKLLISKKLSKISKERGFGKWMVGKRASEETKQKMRMAHIGKIGRRLSESTKRKLSLINTGKNHPNFGKHLSVETRKKISDAHKGEKANNWKGGITPINKAIRMSSQYKQWRTAVFQRDNYACIIGGRAHGSKLQADHIKSFAHYPELRFDISNGRTLCIPCHKKTDTYGFRKKI